MTSDSDSQASLQKIVDLVADAKAAGADAADAVFVAGASVSLAQRLGKPEHLSRSESTDVGLRVFVGQRQAIVSSSDTGPEALAELVERAVAMARVVPEDEFAGLAPEELLAKTIPDTESNDPVEPDAETLKARAAEAEDAARAVEGVTNSEGAEAGWGRSHVAVAASNGFAEARVRSGHSLSASVLAGEGMQMERDYDWASRVFGEDLPSPAEIGRSAGERAVKRLNPRKVESGQFPIVYDPRCSGSLVGHLSGAINGAQVARGTTFLKDKMGELLFNEDITIVDDPLRRRGLASKPFDGEGVATRKRNLIEAGRLTTWILDLRSARQLGLKTTGHASRGTSSPPSPSSTNVYLEPGAVSPKAMIGDIESGLYVIEMMGRGINSVTGDYSRGASGFWIENGELAYPVSELTIAGNLIEMFAHLSAADDLEFNFSTNAPTLRVDGMTVAGK